MTAPTLLPVAITELSWTLKDPARKYRCSVSWCDERCRGAEHDAEGGPHSRDIAVGTRDGSKVIEVVVNQWVPARRVRQGGDLVSINRRSKPTVGFFWDIQHGSPNKGTFLEVETADSLLSVLKLTGEAPQFTAVLEAAVEQLHAIKAHDRKEISR